MKNLFHSHIEVNIKHVLMIVLFGIVIYLIMNKPSVVMPSEGFIGQDEPSLVTSYENAHGSAPAGVNALPGEIQYHQNADSPSVNAANKLGNPQNTLPEFKKQPLFSY